MVRVLGSGRGLEVNETDKPHEQNVIKQWQNQMRPAKKKSANICV
jgi:hypothetical protein